MSELGIYKKQVNGLLSELHREFEFNNKPNEMEYFINIKK